MGSAGCGPLQSGRGLARGDHITDGKPGAPAATIWVPGLRALLSVCPEGGQMGSPLSAEGEDAARWCLLTGRSRHMCWHISWGGGQSGRGFHFTEGPRGVGGSGSAEEDAARPRPGASFAGEGEEEEGSAAFTRHPLPSDPEVRPGQGGSCRSRPRPLPEPWRSVPAAPAAPSPAAREAAPGVWRGQVAGWEALRSGGRWAEGSLPGP